jgi:hypothetical protein
LEWRLLTIVCQYNESEGRGGGGLVVRGFREVARKLHHLPVDFPRGGVEKFQKSDEQKSAPCQSYCSPKYRGASAVVVKEV